MKTLDLVLKGKWYDMISSGEKREEYREIKPYWFDRLIDCFMKKDAELATRYFGKEGRTTNIEAINDDIDGEWISFKGFTHIRFRRGYTNTTMLFKCDGITIGHGRTDWGAPEEEVFIIKLGEMVKDLN